ncbi:dynamin family protein [Alkalibacillus haloalkaliphilus]|uniref:dynamin family protein n=1 Tax=Alkalibacillus haloalkaliphilus TaxID=94136 RepID=UPI002935EAE3|nr:dynamin family protein [Alkalibacillus haloalkaliphilus]MDV2580768.1 dynamin family protein [Alkalibacillus haloalkaliphilus]
MTTIVKQDFNFDLIYKEIQQLGLESEKKKLIDLYEKWSEKSSIIGFTGHFSAGKSTMINALVGEELLPSSPIPTSANIVEINNGPIKVTYHFNEQQFANDSEINVNQIQQLSRNGQEVDSITIQKPLPAIKNTVLMDTPGIDSADDEEFDRTLSRVHLIDYFIYVVDYNHVQSEVNFQFLQQLEMKSIPYIIVVNQVDKHNEDEITMDEYKRALEESCENWNLSPQLALFTSLMDDQHPHNQLTELQKHLQTIIDRKEEIVEERVKTELKSLIEVVAEKKYGSYTEHTSKEELKQIEEEYDKIKDRVEVLNKDNQQFNASYMKSVSKIVDEAYLMTFEMRELAKEYLESVQPNFKVGGLFSKKKTLEEKERRLEQFLTDLNERVKTQVNWHVREFLVSILDEHDVQDHDLKQQLQQFEFVVTEQLLLDNVNPSAEVNGDYVLLFTKSLQKSISNGVKHQLTSDLNDIYKSLQPLIDQQLPPLKEQLSDLEDQLDQSQQSHESSKEMKQFESSMKGNLLSEGSTDEQVEQALEMKVEQRHEVNVDEMLTIHDEVEEANQDEENVSSSYTLSVTEMTERAEEILAETVNVPILDQYRVQVEQKQQQIQNMTYTVALFGAFSAGKSSFANAWIGANVLPVSPNPTTAAINKIAPINEQFNHEDVIVTFKTEQAIVDQVNQILAPYTDEPFRSLTALSKFVNKNNKKLTEQLSKTDASFIEAFSAGLEECEPLLGKQNHVDLHHFRQYVTVERLSCFVDEIIIYYDCELTRSGVTLVDTPGADSIHARHTNVSMHYVKHSDVLVYVNYYNHAFARADREFLKQLGRVKGAFTMDKMFFVLNAADLAQNDNELQMVISYLQDQLQQYGIQHPQTYPISSKQLNEQPELKYKDEDAIAFFNRFNHFIEHDAKVMIAHNLQAEIETLTSFVEKTVYEIDQNQEEQDRLIAQYKDDLARLRERLNSIEPTIYVQHIHQQVDELIHYVRERTNIQLIDLMKDTINPATITQNGRKGQEELKTAIKQLFIEVQQKLNKEFHSTNILLDYHFNSAANTFIQDINNDVEHDSEFDQLYFEEQVIDQVGMPDLVNLSDEISLKELVSIYKNKKDFFEQNRIKELFSQLEQQIDQYLGRVVQQFEQVFKSHYNEQFMSYQQHQIEVYLSHVESMIASKHSIYQDESQKAKLKQVKQTLLNS